MREPALDGYEILPRPGHTAEITYPFYESALVEGTVYTGHGAERQHAAKVRVELVARDGRSVIGAVSEFDGYFVFEKVRPGSYTLKATAETGEQSASRPVTIESSEFYTFEIDLSAPAGPPEAKW
jgi:hypothetical protein